MSGLPLDRLLEQYYTCPEVAADCLKTFGRYFGPSRFRLVEPSAGDGSFLKMMPADSLAYDVDPKCAGIELADFLTVKIPSDREVAIIGNPPFKLAVPFFNHGAWQSSAIGLILPRTFRKGSILRRLDRSFHRIHDEDLPDNAFLFRGKRFNVSATFQIWVRRDHQRELPPRETWHPDFEFTTASRADFAIQRVGADAGRVHHNLDLSASSTHFIRGPVEGIMRQLPLRSVAGNVAGPPSISMSEIVWLYRKYMRTVAATNARRA